MSHIVATDEEKEIFRDIIRNNVILQLFDTDEEGFEALKDPWKSDRLNLEIKKHHDWERVAKVAVFNEMTGAIEHCLVSSPCKVSSDVAGRCTRGSGGGGRG